MSASTRVLSAAAVESLINLCQCHPRSFCHCKLKIDPNFKHSANLCSFCNCSWKFDPVISVSTHVLSATAVGNLIQWCRCQPVFFLPLQLKVSPKPGHASDRLASPSVSLGATSVNKSCVLSTTAVESLACSYPAIKALQLQRWSIVK